MSEKSYAPSKGLKRVINAFFHSISGIQSCFKKEEAFRQEVFLAIPLVPLSFWVGETVIERLLLIGSIFFVLIAELLNAAIERAIDRISFDRHELSKEAKDMGSAAVLLAFTLAIIIWVSISWTRFG